MATPRLEVDGRSKTDSENRLLEDVDEECDVHDLVDPSRSTQPSKRKFLDFTNPSAWFLNKLKRLEARIDKRSRKSRFHGWRMGVLCGCCLSSLVLCCNIALITAGAVSESGYDDEGVADLISGSDKFVSQWNTVLHILINALSTILLSGSNYTMQVLSSPTREDVDNAHSKGHWLDIGILSPRNLQAIPRKRVLLWMLLGCSSIPLHLFYNAAVFKVMTSSGYALKAIDINSDMWSQLRDHSTEWKQWDDITSPSLDNGMIGNFTQLSNSEWQSIYTRPYLSVNGDLYLVIDRVALETSITDIDIKIPDLVALNISDKADPWKSLNFESPDWLWYEHNFYLPFGFTLTSPVFLHVAHAFSEHKTGPASRVQISLYFMLVVIACNFTKLAVMATLLYEHRPSRDCPTYFVTLGDAAASFLNSPDPTTRGKSTFGKEELLVSMGQPLQPQITSVEDGHHIRRRLYGAWLPRAMLQWSTVNRRDVVLYSELILLIILLIALSPLYSQAIKGDTGMGSWGAASEDSLSLSISDLTSKATLTNAGLANLPQLVLSFSYLAVNTICTSMASGLEWNNMARSPKGLRVTRPYMEQRSTYFLQLPYKWSMPLLVVSGTLHWLLSQSFFLVRKDFYTREGAMIYEKSKSACGFSTLSFYVMLVIALLLLLVIGLAGFWPMRMHAPVVASCSLAISAACHPPPDEEDVHLKKVQWGEVKQTAADDKPHCSLSSREVKAPTVGKIYS